MSTCYRQGRGRKVVMMTDTENETEDERDNSNKRAGERVLYNS